MKFSFLFLITTVVLWKKAKDEDEIGIYISEFHGIIDWDKVMKSENNIKFVIHRAITNEGLDSFFELNYEACKVRGIDFSCYIFSRDLNENEAIQSAKKLINLLKGKRMPIYLDLEFLKNRQLGRDLVTKIAKTFINTCKNLGYGEVNICCQADWYNQAFNADELKKMGAKFWIVNWGENKSKSNVSKPNLGERIWQYTNNGNVSGIMFNVDMSYRKAESIKAIEKMVIIIEPEGINKRSSPDSSGRDNLIGGYRKNEKVEVVGITEKGDFYKDIEGNYLTTNPDWVKDLKAVVTTYNLNVRDTSSTSGKKLGTVDNGETVEVLRSAGNGWYYIKTPRGLKGWSYGEYLKFTY